MWKFGSVLKLAEFRIEYQEKVCDSYYLRFSREGADHKFTMGLTLESAFPNCRRNYRTSRTVLRFGKRLGSVVIHCSERSRGASRSRSTEQRDATK